MRLREEYGSQENVALEDEGYDSPNKEDDHPNKKMKNSQAEVISTLFVDRTNNEDLLNILRLKEESISQEWGYKMKIIEKNGIKIKNILVKKDPYRGEKCGRSECPICKFKPKTNKGMDCTKPNALYEAICLKCEEEKTATEFFNAQIEDRIQSLRDMESLGLPVPEMNPNMLKKKPQTRVGSYQLLPPDGRKSPHSPLP